MCAKYNAFRMSESAREPAAFNRIVSPSHVIQCWLYLISIPSASKKSDPRMISYEACLGFVVSSTWHGKVIVLELENSISFISTLLVAFDVIVPP